MILSHKYRFIFLKTKKTAGTSVELALSELCGPDDVVTPLIPRDEALRRVGEPRNYRVPRELQPWSAGIRRTLGHDERQAGLVYFNHMTAAQVRRTVDPAVWRGYRKVTIERNPWDREVSYYFWQCRARDNGPSFEEFALATRGRSKVNNFEIYSIHGQPIADLVLRYERLADDFADFVRSLGVAGVPELPIAKSAFRPPEARDYRRHYSDRTREAVAWRYRWEIGHFGYAF